MGHLPIEILRFTKILLDCGAIVTTTLFSSQYQRSSRVQEWLEILCAVEAKLIEGNKNKEILLKYLEMIQAFYEEPKPEEIIIYSPLNSLSASN